MSDPVQELVNAIAGMRQDLTRVYEQIDKKAATPEQLKAMAATIGKADPAKLAESVKAAAVGAAASVEKFVAGQDVISKRLQSVELDALAAIKEANAVAIDIRKNIIPIGLIGACLGVAIGFGLGWFVYRDPASFTEEACNLAHGDILPKTKDPAKDGYVCVFSVKGYVPPPPAKR